MVLSTGHGFSHGQYSGLIPKGNLVETKRCESWQFVCYPFLVKQSFPCTPPLTQHQSFSSCMVAGYSECKAPPPPPHPKYMLITPIHVSLHLWTLISEIGWLYIVRSSHNSYTLCIKCIIIWRSLLSSIK